MSDHRVYVNMYGHKRGDIVDVPDSMLDTIAPLVQRGFLLPIVPADAPRPKRHRKPAAPAVPDAGE